MALRNIVKEGEPCLRKHCRPVTEFNDHLFCLLDDMKETLLSSQGVGLAAPQVGVLRRAVVVLETNVAEGEDEYVIELINPEIVEKDGEQAGPEGCLSIPGVFGYVTRPDHVKVRAQNRKGEWFEVEGTDLTARAFCHELDHLDGILFRDLADHIMTDEEMADFYGRGDSEEADGTEK